MGGRRHRNHCLGFYGQCFVKITTTVLSADPISDFRYNIWKQDWFFPSLFPEKSPQPNLERGNSFSIYFHLLVACQNEKPVLVRAGDPSSPCQPLLPNERKRCSSCVAHSHEEFQLTEIQCSTQDHSGHSSCADMKYCWGNWQTSKTVLQLSCCLLLVLAHLCHLLCILVALLWL